MTDLTNLGLNSLKTNIVKGHVNLTIFDANAFNLSDAMHALENTEITEEEYNNYTKKNFECNVIDYYKSDKNIITYLTFNDKSMNGYYVFDDYNIAFVKTKRSEKSLMLEMLNDFTDCVEGINVVKDFVLSCRQSYKS